MAVSIVAMSAAGHVVRRVTAASWSGRALDIARLSAIFVAVTAPMSTAAASLGSVVFIVALLLSGRLHRIAMEAWRLPAGKALVAFLAWLLLSASWNAAGLAAGVADFWAWRKLVYLYLALPLFADPRWKHRALVALVHVGALAVVLAYLSVAGWIPSRFNAPGVVYTNYAAQGAAFAVVALCAVELAMASAGLRRIWFAAIAAALVIDVLFFNFGRTGYLALVGATLAWAVLAGGWRATAASAAVLAALLALAFVLSPTFHERVTRGVDEVRHANTLKTETPMGIRVIFLENSLALIRERPITGHGLGSFKRVYADYVEARGDTGVRATLSGDPHNQYVYIVFEQGVIGLALFFVMIASLFKALPRDPHGRLAACALVAWCLTSLFSSHFRTFPEGHFYALLIAILGAPRPASPRTPGQPLPAA